MEKKAELLGCRKDVLRSSKSLVALCSSSFCSNGKKIGQIADLIMREGAVVILGLEESILVPCSTR